ncbi:sorting nexin-10 isoform X5 [Crotalus tigris]|uniref:sorting nexin-10 isoform X5 n=1 Tax=Crotalus tigris TaxID=88082 RepID=UPI00192F6ADE|nr:sorting nexin-10 isoform X5 [Crotalus tigris]
MLRGGAALPSEYLPKIDLHTALKMTPKHEKQEFVTVWVRDPKLQKEDFWHSYIDYEIFIHTNSMCFTIKTSCVRRRFREFVWLRQKLQSNAVLMVLQNPVLLSDSRLHLFVQTQLSPEDIEACVSGNTKYSVAEAIRGFAYLKRRFPVEHEEKKKENYADSDSESSSSGLEHSGNDSNSHRHKASTAHEEP